MSRQTRSDPIPFAVFGAAASLVTVGGLWYALLMRGGWAAERLGPVCHHGSGPLVMHCAACYAALVMVVFGVALAGAGATLSRTATAGAA